MNFQFSLNQIELLLNLFISYIIIENCSHFTDCMSFREIYDNKAILEIQNLSVLRCDSLWLCGYFLMFALRLLDTEDAHIMVLQKIWKLLAEWHSNTFQKMQIFGNTIYSCSLIGFCILCVCVKETEWETMTEENW
jgi:hypothetical protein